MDDVVRRQRHHLAIHGRHARYLDRHRLPVRSMTWSTDPEIRLFLPVVYLSVRHFCPCCPLNHALARRTPLTPQYRSPPPIFAFAVCVGVSQARRIASATVKNGPARSGRKFRATTGLSISRGLSSLRPGITVRGGSLRYHPRTHPGRRSHVKMWSRLCMTGETRRHRLLQSIRICLWLSSF